MTTPGIVSVQQLTSSYCTAHSDSQRTPIDWYDVQQRAITATKRVPKRYSWSLLLHRGVVFFWFSPSIYALLTCLFRRNTVYLCWGFPNKSSVSWLYKLKLWKLKAILKLARTVLVNDEKTAQDLKALGLADVKLFPYVVDTDFFTLAANSDRSGFLLVPGDNDRDETLVSELAAILPYKIVRVTRSQKVVDFHQSNTTSTVEVLRNVSFSQFLQLYQTASIVLLPLQNSDHASGQTSTLEALACGTPVLISQGRTSSIVNRYKSVLEIPSKNSKTDGQTVLEAWQSAVEKMLELMINQPNLSEQTACQIRNMHSPDTVVCQFSEIIALVGNSS